VFRLALGNCLHMQDSLAPLLFVFDSIRNGLKGISKTLVVFVNMAVKAKTRCSINKQFVTKSSFLVIIDQLTDVGGKILLQN
jgi:hypothetical protein